MNDDLSTPPPERTFAGSILQLGRKPRILLLLLAGWSVLAAITQLFVNSGLFLDIHDIELDGALGGFAFSLNALPLAVLYLYCWRSPVQFRHVFWLAFIHQVAMVAGVLYQWAIGTFSFESIVIPLAGSAALAAFSFLQIFEPTPPAPAEVEV
jgi:hypothetical protein